MYNFRIFCLKTILLKYIFKYLNQKYIKDTKICYRQKTRNYHGRTFENQGTNLDTSV